MESDELARVVIEEATKSTLGKTVDGLGKFFATICMPAAEEFGLFLRDRVHIFRINNLARIVRHAQQKMQQGRVVGAIDAQSSIEFIDKASWATDENLQELWAGLLASSMTAQGQPHSMLMYIRQLADLDPYQARILNLVYGDDRIANFKHPLVLGRELDEQNLVEPLRYPFRDVLSLSPTPLDYIVENHSHEDILRDQADHPLAMGYVLPHIIQLKRLGHIADYRLESRRYTIVFAPTLMGLDLYMNCNGVCVYPLDAYLATRRYWISQINKQPLSGSNTTQPHNKSLKPTP